MAVMVRKSRLVASCYLKQAFCLQTASLGTYTALQLLLPREKGKRQAQHRSYISIVCLDPGGLPLVPLHSPSMPMSHDSILTIMATKFQAPKWLVTALRATQHLLAGSTMSSTWKQTSASAWGRQVESQGSNRS